MKTNELISVLCDSINAVHETVELVVKGDYQTDDKGYIAHNKGCLWTAQQTFLSAPCTVFRVLWNELPDSLRCEHGDELVSKLYPHKYEAENYAPMVQITHELHAIVFDLWQEMRDARDKFGL